MPLKALPVGLVFALLLSGCGIKPGELDPPSGADKTTYPRQYPAPEPKVSP